ncbi:MAG TPA: PepSY-like domain-containing protein, partial [Gemmataceae bacterium]|nr:PepSY-like domain-containing protein [Gemmataceae bacterium]
MRTFVSCRIAAVIVGMLVCAAMVQGDEEKVPLDKLPKAVVDAVKAKFPKAKLVSAEKEEEDGATVYEVAIKNEEQSIEVTLTADGKIIEIEKQI